MVEIQACGQRYHQKHQFIYLGGCVTEDADIAVELRRRRQRAMFKLKKYGKQVFHCRSGVTLRTKLSLLQSEVTEALLYGCQTWTLNVQHYTFLMRAHHHALLRCVGFRKKKRTDHVIAYHKLLLRCHCESIEATIKRRRLQWAGKVVRMDNSRLPKAMIFGELVDGKRRIGGPGKQWRQCLSKDLKDFDFDANSWVADAADRDSWEAKIDVGAKTFMARWHAMRVAEADVRHRRQRAAAADD